MQWEIKTLVFFLNTLLSFVFTFPNLFRLAILHDTSFSELETKMSVGYSEIQGLILPFLAIVIIYTIILHVSFKVVEIMKIP